MFNSRIICKVLMLFQSVFLLVEFKYFVSRNNGKNVGRYGGRYFYNPNR